MSGMWNLRTWMFKVGTTCLGVKNYWERDCMIIILLSIHIFAICNGCMWVDMVFSVCIFLLVWLLWNLQSAFADLPLHSCKIAVGSNTSSEETVRYRSQLNPPPPEKFTITLFRGESHDDATQTSLTVSGKEEKVSFFRFYYLKYFSTLCSSLYICSHPHWDVHLWCSVPVAYCESE